MGRDYVGAVVEPWEMDRSLRNYSDLAMAHLRGLDQKCLLVENPSDYGEGHFDLVGYDEFEDYVGDSTVFITGTPESVAEIVEGMDQEIILDRNVFERASIERPSVRQMFKEETASLIPMYEPDRQNVRVKTYEDFLEDMGVEGFETVPLTSFSDRY